MVFFKQDQGAQGTVYWLFEPALLGTTAQNFPGPLNQYPHAAGGWVGGLLHVARVGTHSLYRQSIVFSPVSFLSVLFINLFLFLIVLHHRLQLLHIRAIA